MVASRKMVTAERQLGDMWSKSRKQRKDWNSGNIEQAHKHMSAVPTRVCVPQQSKMWMPRTALCKGRFPTEQKNDGISQIPELMKEPIPSHIYREVFRTFKN